MRSGGNFDWGRWWWGVVGGRHIQIQIHLTNRDRGRGRAVLLSDKKYQFAYTLKNNVMYRDSNTFDK